MQCGSFEQEKSNCWVLSCCYEQANFGHGIDEVNVKQEYCFRLLRYFFDGVISTQMNSRELVDSFSG